MKRNLVIAACAALLAPAVTTFAMSAQAEAEAPGKGKSKDGPKPYDEIIPEDAVTSRGVFLTHRAGEKLYYEIPVDALGDEFLWVTQLSQTQAGYGIGGTSVGDRVVRWELRDESVLLRDVKHTIRSNASGSIQAAIAASSVEPIIERFPVKAWGKDKAPVIEVTGIFLGDYTEFSPSRTLGASGLDKNRSFIEVVKSFPKNIEVKVLATYKLGGSSSGFSFPGGRSAVRKDPTLGAVTALIHHSMVKLPDVPMKPREIDSRVGYFSVSFDDFAVEEHAVETVRYANRWRLEKKDPDAEVSEPKQPIVFYIGRGVPDKWREALRQGVLAWQPVFEAAGFKNAILAKDAPTEREDPDWDAEDARYSVLRWLPSTVENAMGPHVHDPRSGEILEADILVYHNILKLIRDWYFVQASPMDPRAQKLPMPDDLIGELLSYVITHEVGHSLGLRHNMKASSSYTIAELRDPEFTAKYGTEASVMDYGRYNYVSQPGDGARLIPILAPYDYFAIEWGYKTFGKVDDAEERAMLAAICDRQIDDPKLRFGDENSSVDPSAQTEDLGADPILATQLGLKNIDRVAGYLVAACCDAGDDYSLLSTMYGQLIGQRDRELNHVVSVLGGMVGKDIRYGQGDRVFDPVSADLQRQAMAFLLEHGFQTPASLTAADIVDRIQVTGVADRILSSQRRLLSSIISDSRVKRMAEHADRLGADAYTPLAMLRELQAGIWRELDESRVTIDLYRRNLQRAHIDHLSGLVEKIDIDSDLPSLARGELEGVKERIDVAEPRAADEVTRLHLRDLRHRIDLRLEPRSARDGERLDRGPTGFPGSLSEH